MKSEIARNFQMDRSSGNSQMPSMHYHETYELYYLEAGSREHFIEDKLFSASAGDFVLIPPEKLHRTGGEYGVRTLINFSEEFLRKVYTQQAAAQLLRCFEKRMLTPSNEQRKICEYLLRKLADTVDEGEKAILLGMLLTELSKCETQKIADGKVSTIVAYINKNYSTIRTIDEIADTFFISKFYLCRMFKRGMKITVMDYLNQIRIKHACYLLEHSPKNVGQISDMCGFGSAAYFSKLFKKAIGVPPLVYRKNRQAQKREQDITRNSIKSQF
ncbi:MAG: helix-turn-helix domain-containing protein [Ruminococcaceae bacterium]|nr:helix-turn-helix domain-containing protein [Oscillospiraceae bacterium]